MREQELQLRRGWRINTESGTCESTSENCMCTFLFLSVYSESELLVDSSYEYQIYYYTGEIPEEYIYTYAYQNEQQWTTYLPNEHKDKWISGKVTFECARYVRLVFRRKDGVTLYEKDVALVAAGITLRNPKVKKEEYLQIPEVKQEVSKTVKTIETLRTENSMVFTLLSDTHYVVNGNWENTVATMREVNDAVQPDGIIHLGDLADGILDKELCSSYSHQVIDRIKEMGIPFYLTIGNHDTNYFRNNPERLNTEEQYAHYLKDVIDAPYEENQLWYYKDFPEQKLRFLFLHSFDATERVRYGFPEEEVAWVKERMHEMPENYQVVLFSHDAPLARLDFWTDEIRNGEELTSYLEGWHETHCQRILAYIHGHTHADYIYIERAFPIISVGCSKCEFFPDKKPEGSIRYRREMGTVRETLWDTIIIHPKEKKIDFVRFGAGVDRCIENGKKKENRMTQIWAHRGASGYAPENTLEAFALAMKMGADGVELDVQFTKDRELVVLHDERIDRTSDGTGYVVDYTLAELKKMSFNKTHPEYQNVTIPTLREVLELIKPSKMVVNIELKTGINFYDGIEKVTVALVEELGMQDRVIYSSFNHQSVMRVKRICPEAKIGFLYSNGIYNVVDYAKKYGVGALHPSVENMQYEGLVEACKENGVKLHVWTVNREIEMRKLAEAGVDAIMTNYPDVAYEVLRGETATEAELKSIQNARESIPKLENLMIDVPQAETPEMPETAEDNTAQIQPQRARNSILHALGELYAIVRKVFVKIDAVVQKMSGR